MELTKTKYMQTEVGLIPEDWEITKLGLLTHRIGDGIHATPIYSENGEYYFINGNNLSNGKIVITDSTRKVSEREFIIHKRDLTHSTILISINGTIGNLAFYNNEKIILGKSAAYINLTNQINKFFIYQLLQTNFIRKYFTNELTGSTIKNLGVNSIRQTPIPLPPLPEQKAIAEVLSDVDRLIQVTEQKLAKKRAIKQGAMQKLLTPKEDWEVKKLGDFLDYEQPGPYIVASAEYNDNYNTPVLTAGKTFILGYTNEEFGIFENGPVIIFDDFTTATKFVDFNFKVRSSAMKILKKKNDSVNIRFIYDLMQQIVFPLGDHKRHWIGEYQHIDVSVPNQEEQGRIATILSDMDKEIELIEQQIAKYKTLKQGLMQELLTGKTRLTV